MKQKVLFLVIILLVGVSNTILMDGQNVSSRRIYRSAVRSAHHNKMEEAEGKYRAAFKADSSLLHAQYGLGGALYEHGKYDEAIEVYGKAAENKTLTAEEAAALLHNLGNAFMKKQDYPKAAEAFKQSLRINPTDEETRYNLALAMKLMPKQNQNQNQNGGGEQQPEKNQQPQSQPPKNPAQNNPIDQQTAAQILESFREDDDKTRQRVEQQRNDSQPRSRKGKQW